MNARQFSVRAAVIISALAWTAAGWASAQDAKGGLVEPPAGKSGSGNWCEWLETNPGTLYKGGNNDWLQELRFFGLLHVNYAWVNGKSANRSFSYDNDGEIRRLWAGLEAKMFGNALTLHEEIRLADDKTPSGGQRRIDYIDTWASWAEWEVSRTFPVLDGCGSWTIGYGKNVVPLAEEVVNSSKFLSVPERSAISNRLYLLSDAVTPTGAWLRWKNGLWTATVGVYSTDTAPEMGNWSDGTDYVVEVERDSKDWFRTDAATLAMAFYYDDTVRGDDRLTGAMNWVASAWMIVKEGPWTFRANAIYGEADDRNPLRDGPFWGLVLTPSYMIVPDKLEAVLRYQYQGSENPQGVFLYSRYAKTAGLPANENIPLLASGRGDEHHSVYAGLNWLICKQNLKLMAGVEWESLQSKSKDVYQGFTFWTGLRTYF